MSNEKTKAGGTSSEARKERASRLFSGMLGVFIVITGVICLSSLVWSTYSFVNNQKAFGKAYTVAAAGIAKIAPADQETAKIAIDHLGQLQMLQKNAATNDVMSFLYSMLSTVLVGVCAGFVAKSNANVKETSESAKAAKDAAKKARVSAKKTSTFHGQAVEALNLVKSAVKAEEDYKEAHNQMQQQKGVLESLSIHIELTHTRIALRSDDYIDANVRVAKVHDSVLQLTPACGVPVAQQLLDELLKTKTDVGGFRERAVKLPDVGEKTSRLQAADRYDDQLRQAVDHCIMLQ